jgi:hypothetical protein
VLVLQGTALSLCGVLGHSDAGSNCLTHDASHQVTTKGSSTKHHHNGPLKHGTEGQHHHHHAGELQGAHHGTFPARVTRRAASRGGFKWGGWHGHLTCCLHYLMASLRKGRRGAIKGQSLRAPPLKSLIRCLQGGDYKVGRCVVLTPLESAREAPSSRPKDNLGGYRLL